MTLGAVRIKILKAGFERERFIERATFQTSSGSRVTVRSVDPQPLHSPIARCSDRGSCTVIGQILLPFRVLEFASGPHLRSKMVRSYFRHGPTEVRQSILLYAAVDTIFRLSGLSVVHLPTRFSMGSSHMCPHWRMSSSGM